MNQFTKTSTRPVTVSPELWKHRLLDIQITVTLLKNETKASNGIYGAIFVDLDAQLLLTTVIYSPQHDKETLNMFSSSYEKLHSILTTP